MVFRTAVLSFVLGAVFCSTAQQQWKEYAYPAHEFAINAPSPPVIRPDPQAPEVTIYEWQWIGNVRLQINTALQPNCMQVLEGLKKTLPDNHNLHAGSLKDISLNGHAGIEYAIQTSPGRQAFEHLYCVGKRAYTVTVWWPLSQPRPSISNRMFDSFRLLDHD